MCETATPRYRREVKQSKESGGISFPPCLTFFTFFTLRFWVNVSRLSAPGPKLCPNIASMKTTHLPPQPSIDPLRSLRSERGTPRLRTLSLLFLFLLLFRSSFTFSHFHDFIFLFSIFLSLLSFFFLPLTWFGIVMQHKSSTLFTSSGGGSVEGSGRKGEEGRIPPPKYGRSARG